MDGVRIETDLGEWTVYETPGHAPSHVCLYQPERRILISGDHVLGRISLFYDYGYTAGPGRLSSSPRWTRSTRSTPVWPCRGTASRSSTCTATSRATARSSPSGWRRSSGPPARGAKTALEILPDVYGQPLNLRNATWFLSETLSYLRHLQAQGRVSAAPDGDVERWRTT